MEVSHPGFSKAKSKGNEGAGYRDGEDGVPTGPLSPSKGIVIKFEPQIIDYPPPAVSKSGESRQRRGSPPILQRVEFFQGSVQL